MADLKAIVNTVEWLSHIVCRSEALLIAYTLLATFLIDAFSVRHCIMLSGANGCGTFIEPSVIFHTLHRACPDGNLKVYIWQMN